jgi:hypothetical protein
VHDRRVPSDREEIVSELVFREASSAFAQQHLAIDAVRGRASILLSAAAVAASVLGGAALTHGRASFAAWLALASFVGVGIVSISLLWPEGTLRGPLRPRQMLSEYLTGLPAMTVGEIYRDLALHFDEVLRENERDLARLVIRFRIASVFLTSEVLWWVVNLAAGS